MMVVDAYDEVFLYGREGSLRVRAYVDDIDPALFQTVREKVANHESVLVFDIATQLDDTETS